MHDPTLSYLMAAPETRIVACLVGFVCGVVVFSLLARVVAK